eukprot:TRINITY_DN983_c0_g2_i12.p1 TRINITY_DN983_c0_g2~~TRINITY_DN983_c0_g2_i12.p1  ORF type:complete len:273 (+),score=78.30 TRINITY_DN983_c0_g2_i12:74-820(+)
MAEEAGSGSIGLEVDKLLVNSSTSMEHLEVADTTGTYSNADTNGEQAQPSPTKGESRAKTNLEQELGQHLCQHDQQEVQPTQIHPNLQVPPLPSPLPQPPSPSSSPSPSPSPSPQPQGSTTCDGFIPENISFIDCLGRPEQLQKFNEWLGQINGEYQNTLECMVRMMEYSRTNFPSRVVARKMAKEIFTNYLSPTGLKYIGPIHPEFLLELESKIFPEGVEPPPEVFDELGEGCFYRLDEIYPTFLGF